MTRREHLERKLERRREWADRAKARSDARFETANKMADAIPFGQPILVGHHSEHRDRGYRERISRNMERGCEEAKLAAHHAGRADGLQDQLKRSVFSDDDDAIGALEARIAEREAEIVKMTAVNKAWKRGGCDEVARLFGPEDAETVKTRMAQFRWLDKPYSTTNTRVSIRRDKERVEEIGRRQARSAEAEAAPGGVAIIDLGETCGTAYVRATFAEKPDRAVIDALKGAGFRWGAGSWVGDRARLPKEIMP